MAKRLDNTADAPMAHGGIAGAAAAGGFNFQATVTAIAVAHMARAAPLGWLDGLVNDTPVAISAETAGAGDDLRLELQGGEIVEAQIKRGLRAGADLRHALLRLIDAIGNKQIDFGLLIVCSDASRTVRQQLAQDLVRLGGSRDDGIKALATEFKLAVEARGLDVAGVFSRLRIVTVHALPHDQASIAVARAELANIFPDGAAITAAWNYLYRDAHLMMAGRGARRRGDVFRGMRANGLTFRGSNADMPLAALGRLCDWTLEATRDFSILGARARLPIDTAWIELAAFVQDEEPSIALSGLAEALDHYHGWNRRPGHRRREGCQAEALGRFRKLAVVVAGPGMGKTLLLRRVARRYARDGFPVLRVSAKAVGQQMKDKGASFEETVFDLGLDGSNLSPTQLRSVALEDWVLLCDGLDECGASQEAVADGLVRFAAGRPSCRIIATSRPIGYRTTKLRHWRHYEVAAMDSDKVADRVALLLKHIWGAQDPRSENALQIAKVALEESDHARTVSISPLLTAITTALISHGVALGRTKLKLYRAIFDLIEAEPPLRSGDPPAESAILRRTLDVAGWEATASPTATADALLQRCGEVLSQELGQPRLKGRATAERCVDYWCELGVLERVRHADQQAITFVHKTLGEFAAGRYLADLPAAERSEFIRTHFDNDDWVEVMTFAAAQGLGGEIAQALMDRGFMGEAGHTRVLRGLEIVDQSDPPAPEHLTQAILEAAVGFVCADHPTRAHKVGLALAPIVRRAPAKRARWCAGLMNHPQPWTRLVAWTCALEAGPDHYDFEALLVAFREILLEYVTRRSTILLNVWDARNSRRTLMQDFVALALEVILPRLPADRAQDVLTGIEHAEDLVSIGLAERISDLITRLDLTAKISFGESLRQTVRNFRMPDLSGLADRQRVAYGLMLDALGADAVTASPLDGDGPLYTLSAFLRISGFMESTPGDVWTWGEGTDVSAVREVFLGLAAMGQLPLDQLAQDAANLKRSWSAEGADRLSMLFKRTQGVDPDELDRNRAASLSLDLRKLETAVRHRSTFLVPLATGLLSDGLDVEEKGRVVARLLDDGSGMTLWAAGQLASGLPSSVAVDLLGKRLSAPLSQGCAHLYDVLAELQTPMDQLPEVVVSNGLLAKHVAVAVAAAKWVERCATPTVGLSKLLDQAYEHWRITEEPYPVGGGGVPQSPRADLLKTLFRTSSAPLERLLTCCADPRHDVRDVGRESLIQRLREDGGVRQAFVRMARDGQVEPVLLAKVLEADPPFGSGDTQVLCELFLSEDPDLRLAATGLLKGTLLEEADRRRWAQSLRKDTQSEVREAAIRALE